MSEIELPESLREIGDCVFDGCKSLTQLIIPSDVEYIGNFIESMPNIHSIILLTDNPPEVSQDCGKRYAKAYLYGITVHDAFDTVEIVVKNDDVKALFKAHPFWGLFSNINTLEDE
ncbi:MAG: leucine-rich repeat protein [Muribaculaceae bacterium]